MKYTLGVRVSIMFHNFINSTNKKKKFKVNIKQKFHLGILKTLGQSGDTQSTQVLKQLRYSGIKMTLGHSRTQSTWTLRTLRFTDFCVHYQGEYIILFEPYQKYVSFFTGLCLLKVISFTTPLLNCIDYIRKYFSPFILVPLEKMMRQHKQQIMLIDFLIYY